MANGSAHDGASLIGFVDMGSIEILGLRVLGAALVLLAVFWLSKTAQSWLMRHLSGLGAEDEQTLSLYRRIVRVSLWILGGGLALHTLGIDLTHIFTTGGLFAVALAFAMKNLAENLVAGLILRFERAIKRGDVLYTSNGELVRVKRIGPRTTVVRTKEEADRIIPNSDLVQNSIANHTYHDSLHRLRATVGVAYDSDLNQVRETLEGVCNSLVWKSDQKKPQVLLTEFADSSVNYRVLVWIEDPWVAGTMLSKLNEAIWWGLKDAGIVIAFPQLDVHVAGDQG